MKINLIYSFAFIFAQPSMLHASAQNITYENLTAIEIMAENFIKNSDLGSPYPAIINVKPISKKLKLKKCKQDILIEFNNSKKSGNTLLKISCLSPVKWRMHLPVNITLFQDVLVLKNSAIKSQTIDEDDIIVKKMSQKYLMRGFYTHIEQLKQLETKRNLKANTLLSPTNLKARKLIKSGQQVTLQLNYQGLGIKASGTALQSASKGQLIKVRNNSSLKIIEGTVTSAGVVQVNL